MVGLKYVQSRDRYKLCAEVPSSIEIEYDFWLSYIIFLALRKHFSRTMSVHGTSLIREIASLQRLLNGERGQGLLAVRLRSTKGS